MPFNERNERKKMNQIPTLYNGELYLDERGTVAFVNDFKFENVKRFYIVSNHRVGFARDWHGHKTEFKCAMVISGAALIAAVAIDNWKNPSKDEKVYRYNLSAHKPMVLFIPKGYANNFMALTENTRVMFLSNLSVEESRNDDYRYDADYWNPWVIQGGKKVI